MKWYKKTATSGAWPAYVHAVNAEEVRHLHEEGLRLMPDLAARYPSGKLSEMCMDFKVKGRKSASIIGIADSSLGKTPPHLACSITTL